MVTKSPQGIEMNRSARRSVNGSSAGILDRALSSGCRGGESNRRVQESVRVKFLKDHRALSTNLSDFNNDVFIACLHRLIEVQKTQAKKLFYGLLVNLISLLVTNDSIIKAIEIG